MRGGRRSAAKPKPWRAAEVRVPLGERLKLEPGEFFQSDLIGCEVIERGTGQSLGQVTGWHEGGASGYGFTFQNQFPTDIRTAKPILRKSSKKFLPGSTQSHLMNE